MLGSTTHVLQAEPANPNQTPGLVGSYSLNRMLACGGGYDDAPGVLMVQDAEADLPFCHRSMAEQGPMPAHDRHRRLCQGSCYGSFCAGCMQRLQGQGCKEHVHPVWASALVACISTQDSMFQSQPLIDSG